MSIKLEDSQLHELLPDIIMRDEELRRAIGRDRLARTAGAGGLLRRAAATFLHPFQRRAAPASPQLG